MPACDAPVRLADFVSMHQAPPKLNSKAQVTESRSAEEQTFFDAAIDALGLLFSHHHTTVLRVTTFPEDFPLAYDLPLSANVAVDCEQRGCTLRPPPLPPLLPRPSHPCHAAALHERPPPRLQAVGMRPPCRWCVFEARAALLSKDMRRTLDLGHLAADCEFESRHKSAGIKELTALCTGGQSRPAPLPPDEFQALIDICTFANMKEGRVRVLQLYTQLIEGHLGTVHKLDYSMQVALPRTISPRSPSPIPPAHNRPHTHHLPRDSLLHYPPHAVPPPQSNVPSPHPSPPPPHPTPPNHMSECRLRDGATKTPSFSHAVRNQRTNTGPHTTRLTVQCSEPLPWHSISLCAVLSSGALKQLEWLYLDGNEVGDAGMSAIAEAVASGAIPRCTRIALDGNPGNDSGVQQALRDSMPAPPRKAPSHRKGAPRAHFGAPPSHSATIHPLQAAPAPRQGAIPGMPGTCQRHSQ